MIAELKQEIIKLKIMMQSLIKNSAADAGKPITISSAFLEQNTPNPFNQSTVIRYTLPAKFISAQMIITDQTGMVLKQVSLSSSGKGVLNIQAGSLAAGTYTNSLIVASRLIDSKKMVVVK